jgi:hypothetical protein
MRVLGGESATWALVSFRRKRTDGQRGRVRGSLGDLGTIQQPELSMYPQECGEEKSEESKATETLQPSPDYPPKGHS